MKKKSLITMISLALVLVVGIAGTLAWLTDRDSVTNVFTVGDIEIELDEAVVDKYGNPLDEEGNIVDNVEDADRTEKPADADKKEGNHYHLVPGETYVKDPTMTIFKDNEPSYVRMLVKVNCVEQLNAIFEKYAPAQPGDESEVTIEKIFLGYDDKSWEFFDDYLITETVGDADVEKRVYEFRYIYSVDENDVKNYIVPTMDDDTRLAPLFTELKVPGVLTKEDLKTLENLVIEVEGHAIQAATFEADDVTGKSAAQVAWDAFDAQHTKK